MSEKLNISQPEQQKSHNQELRHQKIHEQLRDQREKANHTTEISKDTIESIKQSIEATAISKDQFNVGEKETKQNYTYRATKQIKQNSYKHTLKQTQKHMSKPERAFSRAIHHPIVEKVSDIGAQTIARPSGLISGGLFAFICSLVVLLISKRSGFTYNYLFFITVFVGGYFCGLLVELGFKIIKPKKN